MILKRGYILIFIIIAVLSACKKESLDGDEYIEYVDKVQNGITNTKEIDGLSFQLAYCPTEYLLLKELKTSSISAEELGMRKKDNENMMFFHLRIKSSTENDVLKHKLYNDNDYIARAEYLAYGLEEDIALIAGNDTLFPSLFHFERTYGIAPFADFMIAFASKVPEHGNFHVIMDDRVFNCGTLKFNYDSKDIHTIPILNTN
jgi:hypothetical protein